LVSIAFSFLSTPTLLVNYALLHLPGGPSIYSNGSFSTLSSVMRRYSPSFSDGSSLLCILSPLQLLLSLSLLPEPFN
jgi:hypothetical protein